MGNFRPWDGAKETSLTELRRTRTRQKQACAMELRSSCRANMLRHRDGRWITSHRSVSRHTPLCVYQTRERVS